MTAHSLGEDSNWPFAIALESVAIRVRTCGPGRP